MVLRIQQLSATQTENGGQKMETEYGKWRTENGNRKSFIKVPHSCLNLIVQHCRYLLVLSIHSSLSVSLNSFNSLALYHWVLSSAHDPHAMDKIWYIFYDVLCYILRQSLEDGHSWTINLVTKSKIFTLWGLYTHPWQASSPFPSINVFKPINHPIPPFFLFKNIILKKLFTIKEILRILLDQTL